MSYELTGFDGKVAVVTGAGRMRSIGRPIALALARAGCDVVLTGSGKPASAYPAGRAARRLARHRIGGRRGARAGAARAAAGVGRARRAGGGGRWPSE